MVEAFHSWQGTHQANIGVGCAVGLVPRGVVHLQKVASRGLVTQGRHRARRIIRYLETHNEPEPELEQLWQDFSRHMNTNLSYEELVELEDTIGRGGLHLTLKGILKCPIRRRFFHFLYDFFFGLN